MEARSGAVLDHEEAEAERAEAERIAEEEALEAAGLSDETPDPGHPDENADNPGVGQEPGDEPASKPGENEGEAPEVPDNTDPPETSGELELALEGQLSFNVGGKKKPTGSSIRIVGGRVSIPRGELKLGEKVELSVVVEVVEIDFVNERDNETGQVVGCERRHKVRPVSVGLLQS